MVVNINRCVAIDRPELKIPWFMGSYVEDHNVEYSKYLRLRGTVFSLNRALAPGELC